MKVVFLFIFCLAMGTLTAQTNVLTGKDGVIEFTSNAPLELIKATSQKLAVAINTDDRSFLFTIPMNSFEGFNSALQRTHFNENYLETSKFPKATFDGKIIEEIDFTKPGVYKVRAKGNLTVHGVSQQRIIKSTLTIEKQGAVIETNFRVPLADHKIQIPSVVQQKIADEIYVNVKIELKPRKAGK